MAKTIAIKIDVQGTSEQKQRLEALEKGLNTLTKQRKRLNDQLKEGVITQNQWSRAVAKNNTNLKAYRTELNKTRNQMLGIESFTSKLGNSFSKLGTSIGLAFSGIYIIQQAAETFKKVFQEMIKLNVEFELQMAKVKAITGATSAVMDSLSDSAKELGRNSEFTALEVGKLQEELAKLGFTTPEIIAASEAILQLATATGSELSESAVVAASTLRGFGLDATEMQRVVDVMSKSFTSSALDMEKFKVSMRAVAPVAKTVGLSVEQTTASLGVLVDSGFRAETAGTALRNILLDTRKAGISVSEAFEQIRNSTDPATTSLELFGKENAAAAITLANSTDKTNDLTNALNNADGTAKDMADTLGNTAAGAAKKFDSAWEGLLLSLGDGTQDVLKFVKEDLAEFLNFVTDVNNEIIRLRSIGDSAGLVGMFGTTDFQDELLNLMKTQDDFFKNNASNQEALKSELNKTALTFKGLQEQIKTADEDEAERLQLKLNAEYKYFLRIQEQIKALKEKQKQQEASAELTKVQEEIEAKAITNVETKKIKVDTDEKRRRERAELEKKRATEKAIADAEREADRKLKAEEKFLDKVEKLKIETNQLAINDERKLQLEKLRVQKQALEEEARQTIESKEKLNSTLLDLTSSFNAKEKQVNDNYNELEKQKKIDSRNEIIDFSISTSQALVDSIANIEIASEKRKFERGLITEEQFAQKKYEIEKKAFKRQKQLNIAQAIMNGALAITKAFGQGGVTGFITSGLIAAKTSAEIATISAQSFAEGGFTGDGFGSPDASGFKQAGVVHEGEYVVPKNVLETNRGGALVGALESMRLNKPQPYIGTGFANGGFTSSMSVDMVDMENRIAKAVTKSMGAIQVINNATDTFTEAAKVSNIQQSAQFG